jgi:peptidylprolyl isomerase
VTALSFPNPKVRPVSRPTRRAAALTGALILPLAGLVACGDDEGGSTAGAGIEAVTVEGDPGEEPKVTWDSQVAPAEMESEVLVEGEGEPVEEGDSVLAHLWIGNGFSKSAAYSTYTADKPELLTVDDQLSGPIREGIVDQAVGSRVAVAANAEDAFGEMGNPQLGIGNKDGVVFVIDVIEKISSGPEGTERKPAAWAPTPVEEGGVVTGFDFAAGQEPSGTLRQSVLVEGEGPVVKKGQTIYVDYLGQVLDAKKPFDESYSAQPTSFQIGTGQVVKGWDQGLVGQRVGSRVILEIPPALGYGKTGNEQAGIKGTDTLYFVVDVLAAV